MEGASEPETMADEDSQEVELNDKQKKEIAKWFLLNAPAGEIKYVARDVKTLLKDDDVYNEAAEEAFPEYNKSHMLCLEMSNRTGDIMVTSFGEISVNEYLDPRTAQVATIDHVKQIWIPDWERSSLYLMRQLGKKRNLYLDMVCTDVRDATEEELPSPYIEGFRYALDEEFMKYVSEAYPKGISSVYCVKGNNVEGPGSDFEFVVVISAARHSPQNFCNGSWRSIWNIEFKDGEQTVELNGRMQVGAHYFEQGNVQLDSDYECRDSTIFQSPEDSAVTITNIIRHHETEYLTSLEASYANLPDTTFKDLRRKLPVTRTLFPWHNTLQISLTRDITNELGTGK